MRSILVAVLCVWLAAGCAAREAQMHTFPSQWPAGLPRQRLALAEAPPRASAQRLALAEAPPRASAQRLALAEAPPRAPALSVEPLVLDLDGPRQRSPGPDTARVLTDLLVQKLRQVGVNVSSEQSEYAFQGVVPRLGYSERAGYPRRITYLSQLSYRLVHRPTGAVVWEGNLSQEFEQTVLVNTMTRLPEDPQAPVHVLVDKCIGPTWEAIAADVGQFLKSQPE